MTEAIRWKKLEEGTPRDGRTAKQITNDERKNVFQRHSEKTNAAAVDDARSEMSPAERLTRRGQQKVENSRNRFGDSLNTAPADPRDKAIHKPVQWNNNHVERSGTGRVMDQTTRQIREKMRNDATVSDRAAGRAPSQKVVEPTKPIATNDELVAYCNFCIMAHPEVPLDESVRPADARWYQAVLTNVVNLKRAWYALVKEKKVGLDLAGLLAAFQVCVDHHAFDYCKPRVRGESAPLINIFDEVETPFAGESDELAVLRENIKGGRVRMERMRLANSDEEAEIKRLKAMPFDQLRQAAGSTYKK